MNNREQASHDPSVSRMHHQLESISSHWHHWKTKGPSTQISPAATSTLHLLCFAQINSSIPSQHLESPSDVWGVMWREGVKTGLTWRATRRLHRLRAARLKLEAVAFEGMQLHRYITEAHKYLILQGISRMHSYESLRWKSWRAVSALNIAA